MNENKSERKKSVLPKTLKHYCFHFHFTFKEKENLSLLVVFFVHSIFFFKSDRQKKSSFGLWKIKLDRIHIVLS